MLLLFFLKMERQNVFVFAKSICFYSNLTIKCVVGENTNSRFNNLIELKNADVEQVKKMANIVSSGIEKVLTK